MTQQDKEQLKMEIDHIFESGANEMRIFEMVTKFINSKKVVNEKFSLMEKVKIFYGCNDPNGLEKRINDWLDTNKVNIVRVLQDAYGRLDHHITITIFYTIY